MRRLTISVLVAALIAVPGCSTKTPLDPPDTLNNLPDTRVIPAPPEPFIQIVSPEKQVRQRRVSLNLPSIALGDALAAALPKHLVLPMDAGVDMSREIAIQGGDLPVSEVLEYIAAITGYDIQLHGKTVRIASTSVRSWDLSALATRNTWTGRVGHSSAGSSSGQSADSSVDTSGTGTVGERSATLELGNTQDGWSTVVANARDILGLDSQGTASSSGDSTDAAGAAFPPVAPTAASSATTENSLPTNAPRTWIAADRRLGTITAGGPPQRIRELDEYLSDIADRGLRQIHLALIIVDVTWANAVNAGVDLQAIFNDGRSNLTLAAAARDTVANAGTWAVSGSLSAGTQWTLNVLAEILATNARSYSISRPSITLLNGGHAYITTGEEFSYVSDIDATSDQNGNVTQTASISRLNVGMKFFVSARTTRRNRILVDLIPEVSALTRFDSLSTGSQTIAAPVISPLLTATQVISRSGRPVYVGGITSDRVARALKQLPLSADNPLNQILGSSLDEQDHRELLFIITPTELAV